MRGEWAQLPDDKPANYDANEFAADHGADVLAELLNKPQRPALRYRLLSAAEVANRPPMEWLVRGMLPAQGLAAMYGASGSGRSVLMLDLCAAVAELAEAIAAAGARSAPVVIDTLNGASNGPGMRPRRANKTRSCGIQCRHHGLSVAGSAPTWASRHVQNGTPLCAVQETGGWESPKLARRHAHLPGGRLAPYADRPCTLQAGGSSSHGTDAAQTCKGKGSHRCKPSI
jgi:hypothetical protein